MNALPTPTMFGVDPAAFMSAFVAEMERGGFIAKAGIPEKMWTLEECAIWLETNKDIVRRYAHEEGLPHMVKNPGSERQHLLFHPELVSEWAKARSLPQRTQQIPSLI